MKHHVLILLFGASLLFSGCSNTGMFIASNSTEVQLQEGNYSIIAHNLTGSAETSYLLGMSYSWGMATNSFGIIPLEGSKTLYKDAREMLWNNFEADHFSVQGRKLALVNVQYDGETSNFLLYTKAKITITADVIEFD